MEEPPPSLEVSLSMMVDLCGVDVCSEVEMFKLSDVMLVQRAESGLLYRCLPLESWALLCVHHPLSG